MYDVRRALFKRVIDRQTEQGKSSRGDRLSGSLCLSCCLSNLLRCLVLLSRSFRFSKSSQLFFLLVSFGDNFDVCLVACQPPYLGKKETALPAIHPLARRTFLIRIDCFLLLRHGILISTHEPSPAIGRRHLVAVELLHSASCDFIFGTCPIAPGVCVLTLNFLENCPPIFYSIPTGKERTG